jgi:hypothetical protein
MHLAVASTKSTFPTPPGGIDPDEETRSEHAIAEINAYIAIRDNLIAEAQQTTTVEALKRARLVNDFVETCLKPARTPYEAQSLPDADAVRERKRCAAVRARIAELSR